MGWEKPAEVRNSLNIVAEKEECETVPGIYLASRRSNIELGRQKFSLPLTARKFKERVKSIFECATYV